MTNPNGIHHLALSTGDMKGQIEFFTEVLGMRLMALYWMHGAEGAWHGFLELNESSSLAFVFIPGNEKVETVMGQTHAGNSGGPSSPGTMQHVAFNVDSTDDLLNLRDRIRSKGVTVIGPIPHGLCYSIYFAGPENLTLEIATSGGAPAPLDHEATWIDPEVQKLAGISDVELARYINPEPFEGQGGEVVQPAFDPSKPHPTMPPGIYEMILGAPEELLVERVGDVNPPTRD
jgi:catechol 2,3-dioxygenase-like lactoylglutathione lyase family enzyme